MWPHIDHASLRRQGLRLFLFDVETPDELQCDVFYDSSAANHDLQHQRQLVAKLMWLEANARSADSVPWYHVIMEYTVDAQFRLDAI
jgi:hypothetical protein